MAADIRLRWLIDVVDKGATADLLKQDRALRASLQSTDTQYKRTADTAVSSATRQTEASKAVADAQARESKALSATADDVERLNGLQQEALRIGSRLAAQADKIAGAYSRQAGAAKGLRDEESKLARLGRRASGAVSGVGGAISGAGAAAATVGKVGLGIAGAGLFVAGDLTKRGLELGAQTRAGAAGLGGLTGLNPREATALALIAQAEGVAPRGLGTAFATLGKQATGLLGPKPSKATEEGFKALGISKGQVGGLQNNLPALFDLVYGRSQKLPAAERATVLKTFLGRGATLGGQIELGGPISKQLKEVGGQLGGLDPKKLQDLHETEIKMKLATDALELSFAQTFGPPLIKLFDAVAPAIKPVGEALETGVKVPIEWLKQNAPSVISGIVGGITGKPGRSAQGAPPILPAPGHKQTAAQAGAQPHSQLEGIAHTAGNVLRVIGTEAAKYGGQLLNAFKPALPFFQNVLLPLLKGVGAGLLGAIKGVVPVIKLLATGLGFLGKLAAPIKPVFTVIGYIIGTVFAGEILKVVEFIPKIGKVRGLLPAPFELAGNGILGCGKLLEGAGSVVLKVGGVLDKLPGKVGSIVGGVGRAAGKILHAIAAPIDLLGHYLGEAVEKGSAALLGGLATLASEAAHAAASLGGKIVNAIVEGIKSLPSAIVEALTSIIPSPIRGLLGKIGIHLGLGGEVKPGAASAQQVNEATVLKRATGGLIPAMVSPGEQILYGGRSMIVPGAPTASDSVGMMLPSGAAVLTYSGQSIMAAGGSLGDALTHQVPHFAKGGFVATAYGPPWGGIEGSGVTATGLNLKSSPHRYIVAVDPSVIPLHSQLRITPNPFSYSGTFGAEDTGGAIKGQRIDFYDWRGRAAQNAWGRRDVTVANAGTKALRGQVALQIAAAHREGLVADALQKGIEGASAGSVRHELAAAIGSVTKNVTIPGTSTTGGKMPTGVTVPGAAWNPSRLPIDRWIVPYLTYGASHGWDGRVTSGFRSYAQQLAIYNSGVRPAAKPGTSNHEKANFPGGAVDVTEAARLSSVLAGKPGTKLLKWAGSKDPVHFSYPHGGSYRKGGVAGKTLVGAFPISPLSSSVGTSGFAGALAHVDSLLGAMADARLGQLRRSLVTLASKGGTASWVKALQATISLIDYTLGRHIGEANRLIEERTSAVSRGAAALERVMRVHGIDSGSAAGLRLSAQQDTITATAARRNVTAATEALHIARRSGNKTVIAEQARLLTTAQEELDEALVKGLEDRRNAIRKAAEETSEQAAFGVSSAQNAITSLTSAQALSGFGGSETPAALAQKAQAIQSTLIPALQGSLAALNAQLGVAQATGESQSEIDAILSSIQSAGNEIGSAMVEAADLIRQAAEQAAEEAGEGSRRGVSDAQIGLARLETQERLEGNYERAGGVRAEYITNTLIPALQGELAAIRHEEEVDRSQGDVKKAEEKRLEALQKTNEILEQSLNAQEDIRSNTTPRPGGTLGFTYDNEPLTDTLVSVGDGL